MTVEAIHQYLFATAIPETLKVINEQFFEGECPLTISSLLAISGLSKLSVRTLTRWMRQLGFKFEERKKTYYVELTKRVKMSITEIILFHVTFPMSYAHIAGYK